MTTRELATFQRPQFPPPCWAEVEAAVHALDGAARPLFTFAPDGGSLEGCLTVQGHPGAYTLTAYLAGRGRFRYFDPHQDSTAVVEIFNHELLHDSVSARYVCADVVCVLGIARHFWEYGDLHPAVSWEKV